MISYLEALAAIALSLSVLTAGAWIVQQRTGNSGWVDTIWTFSHGWLADEGGLVGVFSSSASEGEDRGGVIAP